MYLNPFPKLIFTKAAAKWSTKRDALDAFIEVANVPKIANGDYSEVARIFKKLVGDVIVVVVAKAIKCVAFLATGLRIDFSAHSKSILPTLLEKFKETKKNVTDAIHEALDAMYGNCLSLADVMEDIQATVNNKVPKVRQDTCAWLTRSFSKSLAPSKRALVVKQVKGLSNYLLQVGFISTSWANAKSRF